MGQSVENILELCPNPTNRDRFAVRGSELETAKDEVTSGLRKFGIQEAA